MREAHMANGTTRKAPTAPQYDAGRARPSICWPTSATPMAAISQNSDPFGADRYT
jgi:hypothetical protein